MVDMADNIDNIRRDVVSVKKLSLNNVVSTLELAFFKQI